MISEQSQSLFFIDYQELYETDTSNFNFTDNCTVNLNKNWQNSTQLINSWEKLYYDKDFWVVNEKLMLYEWTTDDDTEPFYTEIAERVLNLRIEEPYVLKNVTKIPNCIIEGPEKFIKAGNEYRYKGINVKAKEFNLPIFKNDHLLSNYPQNF